MTDVAENDGPMVSFGATLARAMNEPDMRQHFQQLPADRALGMIHVAICKSHMPDQVNVECLLEGTIAAAAVVALEVAAARLRKIHRLEPGEPVNAIAGMSALRIMEIADELVRLVRDRGPEPADIDPGLRWSLTHRQAVLRLVSAFITARAMIEDAT